MIEFLSLLRELKDLLEIFCVISTSCFIVIALSLLWIVLRWEVYITSFRNVNVYHYYPDDDPDDGEEVSDVSNKQGEVINFPPQAS